MASPPKTNPPKRPSPGKTADPAEPAPESPAIDRVLADLERVVAELEAGELPLEAALKRFEDGVRLARQGTSLLDAVEQRVEMLLENRDETVPFPGAGDGRKGAGRDDDQGEEDDDDENF